VIKTFIDLIFVRIFGLDAADRQKKSGACPESHKRSPPELLRHEAPGFSPHCSTSLGSQEQSGLPNDQQKKSACDDENERVA